MIFLKSFKTKNFFWSFDRTLKLKPMGRNSKSVNLLDFEKFNFEISKLRTIILTSYDVTDQNWVYIMKADGCVFSTIYFLLWDSIVFAIYREKSIFGSLPISVILGLELQTCTYQKMRNFTRKLNILNKICFDFDFAIYREKTKFFTV